MSDFLSPDMLFEDDEIIEKRTGRRFIVAGINKFHPTGWTIYERGGTRVTRCILPIDLEEYGLII